jgi:CheY-like chemotaxis protein
MSGESARHCIVPPKSEQYPEEIATTDTHSTARERRLGPVLIVEDDPDIRESLAEAVSDAGYDVLTAADGAQAIDILGVSRPCFMLLDLMMPIIDGWQIVNQMNTNPRLPKVPFCIVSAVSGMAPEGAECVIVKPINMSLLLDAIRQNCG